MMSRKLLIKVFSIWLLFLPLPIINGILREAWYKEITGPLLAGQIGCLLLSASFLFYVYCLFSQESKTLGTNRLYLVGGIWLLLTLIFEFSLGFATGKSLNYLLEDYQILEGRLWPLVLMTIFFSPVIIKKITKT